jgi:2-methylcitrate dehydratase PrpD
MGATETLARFIAETSYDRLPRAVVDAAKIVILDGVANLLAGSTQPLARPVVDYVRALGGAQDCRLVGWDQKTNPFFAAFANGVFLHCLDFEVQGYPAAHGTSSMLPPALALGEQSGASGQTLIAAFVVGWDVQARLRTAAAKANLHGFHPPGVFGPMAAAAACAKVLDFDARHTRMALGVAASRTGGLFANNGTMVKATHPGNAGRMGVEASLLARLEFTSHESILEALHGYVEALFGDTFDWELLTKDLGRVFHLVEPGFSIKRYPAEIYMQWPIEAVAALRQKHQIRVEEVEELEVEVPPVRDDLSRPQPQSGLDGKFSFEYCAAVALAEERVGIDSFTDATRFSPRVEDALRKVRLTFNPEIPRDVRQMWTVARIRLKDGRTFSERCQGYRGSLVNPMDREERLAKFRDCAGRVLPPGDVERTITMLEALERLDDVRGLMAILGQRPVARAETEGRRG